MAEKLHIEEDWWTPDQIELANDGSRIWEKRAFVAQSGSRGKAGDCLAG